MEFTKLQGAGNDFILIEAGNIYTDWSKLAVAVCDRHFGIGSDGLLLLSRSKKAKANFRMRMFNPDGSEAEACGNGLRCFARYIQCKGLSSSPEIKVETFSGTRTVKYEGSLIKVSMGRPELNADKIPVIVPDNITKEPVLAYPVIIGGRKLLLDFVSMGNPHAIYFWKKSVSEFPLKKLGPKIEHHPIFPRRINFEVAQVKSSRDIEVQIWERGAGETLACGSGACAVAVASRLHGYTGNTVNVTVPGGTLNVQWEGAGEVYLGGPAEVVFTGTWIEGDK